jgi:hypothetical protein
MTFFLEWRQYLKTIYVEVRDYDYFFEKQGDYDYMEHYNGCFTTLVPPK